MYFLFATVSRPAPGHIQLPIQFVPGVLSPGIKWLDLESKHTPPSSTEVKNVWSYSSTPQMSLWHYN